MRMVPRRWKFFLLSLITSNLLPRCASSIRSLLLNLGIIKSFLFSPFRSSHSGTVLLCRFWLNSDHHDTSCHAGIVRSHRIQLWRRNFPNNASKRARALREKRNREIFKMLITLIDAFYACSLPILTLQLSFALDFYVVYSETRHFRFIALLMLFLNGAINPIIYIVFNRSFRSCVKEVLSKRYCCQPVFAWL